MSRISLADLDPHLNLTNSQKFLLILRHFLASPYGPDAVGRDLLNCFYTEYKKHQRQESDLGHLAGAASPVDQLEIDLGQMRHALYLKQSAIYLRGDDEDHLLIEAGGQVARGAQSRVGEALGIPNAGQSNRDRILTLLDYLASIVQQRLRKAA